MMKKKFKRFISSVLLLCFCTALMLSLTGAAAPIPDNEISCACDVKCTVSTVNVDCIICATAVVSCIGEAPEEPEVDITPKYSISITSPDGWKTKQAEVLIFVTDENKTGFSKVECKAEQGGNWQDLTDSLTLRENIYSAPFELSENCTVYVSVTDKAGKTYTKSRYIECFDRTAPTVRAGMGGKLLRAEAEDDLSGVAAIYVCGNRFTELTNGTIDIRLADYADEYEQITVNAVDEAGNKSKTVSLKNPYYEVPKVDNVDKEKPTSSTPDTSSKPPVSSIPEKPEPTPPPVSSNSSKPEKKPTPTDTSSDTKENATQKPFTPNGTGTVIDNATDEEGKEFYTITTADENVFYLIIDKQRENDNVYFLNAVTEGDLSSLATQKNSGDNGETAVPDVPICSCENQCEVSIVDTTCPVCLKEMVDCKGTEKPLPIVAESTPQQSEKGNAGTIFFIALAIILVGGAGFYFKIYKPRHDVNDAEDLDELLDDDEEESINEDGHSIENEDYPDDDYPEDYDPDEEERNA